MVAVAFTGCSSEAPSASRPSSRPTTSTTRPADPQVASLTVAPSGTMASYARAAFGPAWADVDHNGCDTRNDTLNRDLTNKEWRTGTHGCVVITGILADPYTGRAIQFMKAQAIAVQIDHVVALGDAWKSGAARWSASEREQFANDPLNLLAVDGSSNESKRDDDASQWLPPNVAFRCSYVERQIAVKTRYRLSVTEAEAGAMTAVLDTCG
jgi:hypothetical protein